VVIFTPSSRQYSRTCLGARAVDISRTVPLGTKRRRLIAYLQWRLTDSRAWDTMELFDTHQIRHHRIRALNPPATAGFVLSEFSI